MNTVSWTHTSSGGGSFAVLACSCGNIHYVTRNQAIYPVVINCSCGQGYKVRGPLSVNVQISPSEAGHVLAVR